MKPKLTPSILRAAAKQQIAWFCLLLFSAAILAQTSKPAASSQAQPKATVPALLISDIHFEPFWDPAKVPQLAAAPVSDWRAILAAAPSPDQQARFDALQKTCHPRGADTSFPLFDSSLKAMQKYGAGAKFVTVSGDLISHAFQCKYNTLFPASTPEEKEKLKDSYRIFVKKTLAYVIGDLDGALPGVPVYVALGNNDSDCGDYRLDAHSEFLAATGKEVTKNFPASERQSVQESFAAGGYYSVSLPAPIENARLLVLNDIFMSSNYATCTGKADQTESAAQLAWLRQQLAEARANKQKVWVMGHIPPGVDLHATVSRLIDVCSGQKPAMFLSSEKLANELVEYDDVIELAVFAHTHMDGLRFLKDGGQSAVSGKGIAVKMVPSISPINGNHPSITLAQVDPSSAALKDYKVFAASNSTGVEDSWAEEYDFASNFHKAAFSSSSVHQLIDGFASDPDAKTEASQHYAHNFFVGDLSPVLVAFWPQYVCTLSNDTEQTYRACVCSTEQ